MKRTIGLWIDHRKAVIVSVSARGEETRVIQSKVEKQPGRFDGVRSTAPYESQMMQADDSREKKFTGQLNTYYDEVVSAVRQAEAILIFGPGEAKGELIKRLERDRLGGLVETVETADAMTDPQIAAKVREYFQK
jgi:stalled ribosome rescue protein Dom34